jgi:hypothetical protein
VIAKLGWLQKKKRVSFKKCIFENYRKKRKGIPFEIYSVSCDSKINKSIIMAKKKNRKKVPCTIENCEWTGFTFNLAKHVRSHNLKRLHDPVTGFISWVNIQPADAPVDAPIDAPVDAPADAPVDAPADAPVDAPVDAPADAPIY